MEITIKDHKGGMYMLFTKNGKTFVRSIGRYNFSGEVVKMESSVRMGEKFTVEFVKNGLYGDPDSSVSVFESGIVTDITVSC